MSIWRWRIDVEKHKNMAMPPKLSKSQTSRLCVLTQNIVYAAMMQSR
ncbi:hypothetical protein H6F39_11255 [Anabaena sp. FACHB-1250]|uniref:Uncharacterized protein n=1 Tax=Dolichospermum flos-aquae LEGE 04289 TaxID=1828708 RepID=A0ACC5Q5R4_DOLFA|nr:MULTISPECIES: hypothetical protein [Nostocales]MBD2141930.1 hypothetical protein [Anabaena sp. FACHB-1250]MBD2269790.1 hypothetical protein [Anabaena sp. FACHB-1391]MBE9220007.1 hypothetical protein [Dolichospermum flos-aquae LEGE 04289]